jgi:hypothetical protein
MKFTIYDLRFTRCWLLFGFLFTLFAPGALAGNMVITLLDGFGNAITNEKCILTFTSAPQSQNGGTAVQWRGTAWSGTNGVITLTNCSPGNWQLAPVDDNYATFTFQMPVTNGTVYAQYEGTADAGNTLPSGQVSYDTYTSDLRYARLGSGGNATNVNFYPGQNTAWMTVGGSNQVNLTGTLTNNTMGSAATATSATSAVTVTGPQSLVIAAALTNNQSTAVNLTNTANLFRGNGSFSAITNSQFSDLNGPGVGYYFDLNDTGDDLGLNNFIIYSENQQRYTVVLGSETQGIYCHEDFDFIMDTNAAPHSPFFVGENNNRGDDYMQWMNGDFTTTNGYGHGWSDLTNGNETISGTNKAAFFFGNGSELTNLQAFALGTPVYAPTNSTLMLYMPVIVNGTNYSIGGTNIFIPFVSTNGYAH